MKNFLPPACHINIHRRILIPDIEENLGQKYPEIVVKSSLPLIIVEIQED